MKSTCPRCGWDFLNTELVAEQRTGQMVCTKCYDPLDLTDVAIEGSSYTGVQKVTVTDSGSIYSEET